MSANIAGAQDRPDRTDRPDRLARVPWAAVILYVVIAFGLAWLVALPLWLMDREDPMLGMIAQLVGVVMMFAPAVAALVVVFAMRAPRAERMRFLGIWPLRPAKRVVWFTVAALFAAPIFWALGTLLAGALGLMKLDLGGLSLFQQMVYDPVPESVRTLMPPPRAMLIVQLVVIPLNAILAVGLPALGEELGWRGWLLPALRPLGLWPALILSGAIWGLWHAPLTLLGHNYGLTDWRGVAMMVVNCIVMGVVLGWLRLRSASVWPAVFAHAAINAGAGIPFYFGDAAAPPNMLVVGAGWFSWVLLAVLVMVLMVAGQFRREPQLAPRRVRWAPGHASAVDPAPAADPAAPASDPAAAPGSAADPAPAPDPTPAPSDRTDPR